MFLNSRSIPLTKMASLFQADSGLNRTIERLHSFYLDLISGLEEHRTYKILEPGFRIAGKLKNKTVGLFDRVLESVPTPDQFRNLYRSPKNNQPKTMYK